MGSWVLQSHGIQLISTNMAESFNAVLKRATNFKHGKIDATVIALYRLSQLYEVKIWRGRYRLGEYELRIQLNDRYDPNDPNAKIPELVDVEKLIRRIKESQEQKECEVI